MKEPRIKWILAGLFFVIPAFAVAQEGASSRALLNQGADLYQKGHWEQAREAYERAHREAPAKSVLKAEASLELTNLLWEQGYYGRASEEVKGALALAKELDLDEAVGRLLLTQGHIEASLGRLVSAENTLKICVKMTRERQDEVFGSLCTLNHRLVRKLRGKPTGPEGEFERAVEALEASGHPLAVGSALAKTAELYEQNAEYARALGLLRKAQDKFQEAQSVPAKTRNRLRFARVLQAKGDYAGAQAYLDGLVGTFKAMNNRPALVDGYMLEAQDAEYQKQTKQARDAYGKALSVAKGTGSPQMVARVSLAYCEFAGRRGLMGAAKQHCEAASAAFEEVGIPALAARAKVQLAALAQMTGELQEARRLYREVIAEVEGRAVPGSITPGGLATQRANLCQVNLKLRATGAFSSCLEALEALEALPSADPEMLAMTEYATGLSADLDGSPSKGIENLSRAAELAAKLKAPRYDLAADAMLQRGAIVARAESRRAEALADFERGLDFAERGKGDAVERSKGQLRVQLAQLLMADGRMDDARSHLGALIEDRGRGAATRAWAYSAMARVHLSEGDEGRAREALEAGLPLAKKSGDAGLVETFEANLAKFER